MTNALHLEAMADELSNLCGAEHIRIGAEMLHAEPANIDEISKLLRWANDNRLKVSIRGGGTKSGWGNPVEAQLVLGMDRLDQLREHIWQDMTCTVEAGCHWQTMQTALARHGQFVALDPMWPERATIGGIVATNDSGSLRHRYGSLRDLIIGMTVVLADGTIARSGGKVVKNVAGYDLPKLMNGAFGTLGVIAEVTIRLHSIPQNTLSLSIGSQTADPLAKLLLKILDSHLSTESLQLRGVDRGFVLDARLRAIPAAISQQIAHITSMAENESLSVEKAEESIWTKEGLFSDRDAVVVKATMSVTDIARFCTHVQKLGGRFIVQMPGIMVAAIPVSAANCVQQLREELESVSGSLTVLQQPEPRLLSVWGRQPNAMALMQEVKRRFDPNRTLNPGRFLGGI